MVIGPDEKPEIGRHGSECKSAVGDGSLVLKTSQFFARARARRSTFVSRRRDRFSLTNQRENPASPVPSANGERAFYFIRKQVLEQFRGETESVGLSRLLWFRVDRVWKIQHACLWVEKASVFLRQNAKRETKEEDIRIFIPIRYNLQSRRVAVFMRENARNERRRAKDRNSNSL